MPTSTRASGPGPGRPRSMGRDRSGDRERLAAPAAKRARTIGFTTTRPFDGQTAPRTVCCPVSPNSTSSVTSSPIRRRAPAQSSRAGLNTIPVRGTSSGIDRRFGVSFAVSATSGSPRPAIIAATASLLAIGLGLCMDGPLASACPAGGVRSVASMHTALHEGHDHRLRRRRRSSCASRGALHRPAASAGPRGRACRVPQPVTGPRAAPPTPDDHPPPCFDASTPCASRPGRGRW